jgi:hypothetical protein
MVRALHQHADVNWGSDSAATRTLEDGLGLRRLDVGAADRSAVDVLEISPALAALGGFEAAVRLRIEQLASERIDGVARVHRLEREGGRLLVVADHIEGLRLPDLLLEAAKGNIPLSQPAALELAGRLTRIVSALHRIPGFAHGAITPSHVVVTRRGDVVLTDTVFGPAIEGLQLNREQLWNEFRLALPASASLPRFDQRADVAELGATVLAIVLGRSLRAGEYPRAINEVVIAATLAAKPGETGTSASALRMWLQEALCLHPRANFASALDAERAFAQVLGPAATRRGGAAALESALKRIFGDTPASAEAAKVAADWSAPEIVHPVSQPFEPEELLPEPTPVPGAGEGEQPSPLGSLFRSVFPLFRAS